MFVRFARRNAAASALPHRRKGPDNRPMEAPLIDCHAHIYTVNMPLAGGAWHRPAADATYAAFLDTLRTAGISYGVLAAASLYGDYNDYSIEATRRHRSLRTTVIVDPSVGRDTLRAMRDDGVVGIRLQWLYKDPIPDLRSPDYRRLLTHLADLDLHVQVHDDGSRVPALLAALEPSGVKIVVDHFGRPSRHIDGRPEGLDAVRAALGRGRTWLKLSAPFRLKPRVDPAVVFREALQECGPERLMWGSDWPFAGFEDKVTYPSVLASYHEMVPDPAIRAAIDRTGVQFYFGKSS